MDLNVFDVIKGPRISEKAYKLNQKTGKLVLEVHPKANKPMIAEALKKLFNVDAEKIGIVMVKGKQRRSGRYHSVGITKKKAIVTLKEGQSVDVMGISEPQMSAQASGE